MSRIIVKNLPKSIKEERLRSVFGEKGYITDCALKYTKDGIFRKFAFIGYKSTEDAQAAVEYFHQTYIDTSRLQVEFAKDLGDLSKPRSWSKYSKDSSAFKKVNSEETPSTHDDAKKKKSKENKVDKLLGDLKDDPQFQEFLDVHKNRGTKALWTDGIVPGESIKLEEKIESKPKPKATGNENDDMESENESENASDTSSEEVEEGTEKKQAATSKLSDLDYIKSKIVSSHLLSSEEDSDSDESEKEDSSDADESSDTSDDEDTEPTLSPEKAETFKYFVKMRGLPVNVKESQIVEFFNPLKTNSIKIPRNAKGSKNMRVASVEFYTESDLEQAMRRNKNFIGQQKIFLHKIKEKFEQITPKARPWETKKQDDDMEGIEESGRLYVRNLAYCCEEADLDKLFAKYGPLTEVNLPIDRFTKKGKGFAFITFMMPEHAVKAFAELDGKDFQGRMLHILPGKPKKEVELEENDSMSFKQKKELKQKKEASSSHNWNTLFLGANAVADVMAEKYGTSKDAILSTDSKQSLGVRMALGETQVVAETRQFLIDEGVALDAFSQAAAERSKTVILVKNLPANTRAEEIKQLFNKHGTLGRVLLPPSGITAIVEFAEPTEARKAFRSLAYSKFQHIPLYLEWAPVGVFSKPYASAAPSGGENEETGEKEDVSSDKPELNKDVEIPEEEEISEFGSTLFVKNLNFDTTEDSVKEHFKKYGKLIGVTIAKKKDLKNTGQVLSMGYGFVEYVKKKSADKALRQLHGSLLDGHELQLKISNRATVQNQPTTSKRKEAVEKKQKSTKILVRNIPFEAKAKEVQELFSVFGELKFVRLPKKVGGSGSHRGFGFVDFLTKEDAKRAFNALCHSTHLYGRRLVLEWAETEENVDQLRKKTAEHYHNEPTKKKFKKSSLMADLNNTENPD